MEQEKVLKEQERLNERLALLLRENRVRNLYVTSYGNSIASGYSMMRTIKPLLIRNNSICSIMNINGIQLERHAYARAQNNNDDHLFEWIVSNIKESEINKMNRSDYSNSATSMPIAYLDNSMLDYFYPLEFQEDKGLRDIIESRGIDLANIIIYNGCTGSFLDNITRNGKLTQMLLYGINRDIKSLEAILKYIQSSNRKNNTNTQIYICGVPNFLGLNISGIINNKLKKVVKQYAHTSYVEPVKSKFFYKNIATGKLGLDIHYDEVEYDKLNNNILETIINNYEISKAMIDSDRRIYNLSSKIELEENELFKQDKLIIELVEDLLDREQQSFSDIKSEIDFYKRILSYLIEREPYDYFYLGKKNIKTTIEKKLKQKTK